MPRRVLNMSGMAKFVKLPNFIFGLSLCKFGFLGDDKFGFFTVS